MAIKITHSVNDGEYGGISIITWDQNKSSLVSSYFTTEGFTTNALMHFENGKLISLEDVTGNANGITKVKAIIEMDLRINDFKVEQKEKSKDIDVMFDEKVSKHLTDEMKKTVEKRVKDLVGIKINIK